MKKNKLYIDLAIAYFNMNRKNNEKEMNRISLGKIIFGKNSLESTINSTLSHWANGSAYKTPTVAQIKMIHKTTGVSLDVLFYGKEKK